MRMVAPHAVDAENASKRLKNYEFVSANPLPEATRHQNLRLLHGLATYRSFHHIAPYAF